MFFTFRVSFTLSFQVIQLVCGSSSSSIGFAIYLVFRDLTLRVFSPELGGSSEFSRLKGFLLKAAREILPSADVVSGLVLARKCVPPHGTVW
jgi:hypothetical protein